MKDQKSNEQKQQKLEFHDFQGSIALRGNAVVDIGGQKIKVAHYDLYSYRVTILNGRTIDSLFFGDLYFYDDEPPMIPGQVLMTHEGSLIRLEKCERIPIPNEVSKNNPDIQFGFKFRYATRDL